jgi:hypothetical protein
MKNEVVYIKMQDQIDQNGIEDKLNLLEICPRGNNKMVIIYLYVYDECLHTML